MAKTKNKKNIINFKEEIERKKFEKLTIDIVELLQVKYGLAEAKSLEEFSDYLAWFYRKYGKLKVENGKDN